MGIFSKNKNKLQSDYSYKDFDEKRNWKKIILILAAIILLGGVAFAWKAGLTLNKISTKGGVLESIIRTLPITNDELKGESDGEINILLLGMRGKNIPGGSFLADTIMLLTVRPMDKKASLVSIPRDLYVNVPGQNFQSKVNAVYHYGEERKKGGGLEDMEKIIGEISGKKIHYATSIGFNGFVELVDSLGGVDLYLEEEFIEPLQFKEEHVCDEHTFTEESGNFEQKIDYRGKVVAEYPLCYNKNLECGGIFKVPAGNVTLDGENALCYVRSRVTSSDFERARRQQEVLEKIKEKALNAGTLTDFGRINDMLDALGDNVRTDMKLWEIKRFWEIYQETGGLELKQKVLENSEEGLLYSPEITTPEQGYILLPRGDNYDRIKEMFSTILN